ncbi:MAG: ABC-type uncharacterized transport system involved in gliding motility auxiliary subunit [Oceanicoccus sp.]|jgi:ABC-type uncharacterized transport system involved in gliding motility auxiliary subunit
MSNLVEKLSPKLLPILCGLGLLVFVLGLSFIYIEQQLSYLVSAVTALGLCLSVVVGGLIINPRVSDLQTRQLNRSSRQARRKKLVLIAFMIFSSMIFIGLTNYFANSTSVRWDLTADKQHTLSKNTLNFISDLKGDVKLTAFYVGIPPKYLEDLFKEYERVSSGLISTQIIDPIEKIAFAATFGNVVNGEERKVIVQSGITRKDIDFTEESLSEEKLSNAIVRVSRAPRQLYFLTGHGEYSLLDTDNAGLSTFKKILADNNISAKPLMLGISQLIPDDCAVLVIAGARSELTDNEETLISDYLMAGGDALFLIENTVLTTSGSALTAKQKRKNPSLNNIINQWGLDVKSDTVIDLSNHVGDDPGSPATKNYGRHKAITEGLDYTFYVRPRSIRMLEDRRKTLKIAPMAFTQSSENSWAESSRSLDIAFDKDEDTAGPVPISYIVYEEDTKTNEASATRLIIVTDADFLTNVYINQYSNAQMGLNIINWLAELDYKIFLSQKEIKVERLDLTSKQKRQVAVILFLLPFSLVIAGVIVWLRSKGNV